MEEKEIKEGSKCGSKCCLTNMTINKNAVICILATLLILVSAALIGSSVCHERREGGSGGRDFRFGRMMDEQGYRGDRQSGDEGGNGIRSWFGPRAPKQGTATDTPIQAKRSPDSVPAAGSPVDILPTNPQ